MEAGIGFERSMRIQIKPDVLMQEVQGEAVLLSVDEGMYYGLNEVGTRAWKYLTETGSTEDAMQGILGEFEVDEETLRADLEAFVEDLLAKGLAIRLDPSP